MTIDWVKPDTEIYFISHIDGHVHISREYVADVGTKGAWICDHKDGDRSDPRRVSFYSWDDLISQFSDSAADALEIANRILGTYEKCDYCCLPVYVEEEESEEGSNFGEADAFFCWNCGNQLQPIIDV